uniref:galactose-specific lectin nattectin-like isoform X2 n=1 Tax=Doryrhamphus excisus TaxID=161450 RepID=UPI0025ADAA86|nr:galactose-specific lectin nattectin-like isoform X2 [Doryrhamphus excisus]
MSDIDLPLWGQRTDDWSCNQCPTGWTRLDNRCFIVRNDRLTFAEAEENCKRLGGNLASIRSPVEQALIDVLTEEVLLNLEVDEEVTEGLVNGGDFWIGLHFSTEEEDFVWTDGSDFDFDLLNSVGDIDDIPFCVLFDGGVWSEASCSESNSYVCARDVFQCVSICMQQGAPLPPQSESI